MEEQLEGKRRFTVYYRWLKVKRVHIVPTTKDPKMVSLWLLSVLTPVRSAHLRVA